MRILDIDMHKMNLLDVYFNNFSPLLLEEMNIGVKRENSNLILGFKGLTLLSKATNIDMGVFPFPLSLLLPPPLSSPLGWLCNHRRRKVQNRNVYFLFHTLPHVGCKQNSTARNSFSSLLQSNDLRDPDLF